MKVDSRSCCLRVAASHAQRNLHLSKPAGQPDPAARTQRLRPRRPRTARHRDRCRGYGPPRRRIEGAAGRRSRHPLRRAAVPSGTVTPTRAHRAMRTAAISARHSGNPGRDRSVGHRPRPGATGAQLRRRPDPRSGALPDPLRDHRRLAHAGPVSPRLGRSTHGTRMTQSFRAALTGAAAGCLALSARPWSCRTPPPLLRVFTSTEFDAGLNAGYAFPTGRTSYADPAYGAVTGGRNSGGSRVAAICVRRGVLPRYPPGTDRTSCAAGAASSMPSPKSPPAAGRYCIIGRGFYRIEQITAPAFRRITVPANRIWV